MQTDATLGRGECNPLIASIYREGRRLMRILTKQNVRARQHGLGCRSFIAFKLLATRRGMPKASLAATGCWTRGNTTGIRAAAVQATTGTKRKDSHLEQPTGCHQSGEETSEDSPKPLHVGKSSLSCRIVATKNSLSVPVSKYNTGSSFRE